MLNRKGFTLIELMIVVVIIGILAAIATPNFIDMQNRAKESKVKLDAKIIQQAVEDYASDHGGQLPDYVFLIVPYLPDGMLLENRFTGRHTEPASEEDFSPGRIFYQVFTNGGSGTQWNSYEIKVYGKDETSGRLENGVIWTLRRRDLLAH